MIPKPLTTIERELRNAIGRRQYSDLPERLEKLRRLADTCIAELSVNNLQRQEIVSWMLATIEWARLMVVTQRQAWSDELVRLPRVERYFGGPSRQPPGVCLDL